MDQDLRKSFRILVPEGQEQALLRVGRREATVRVVDSSAGGFALACNQTLPVCRGDVLRLRTSAGWHEVRVVRQESYTDGVFMGVERIAEITDPREMESLQPRWSDYFFLPYFQSSGNGTKAAGLFTGGALVGIVLAGFVTVLANYQPPKENASMLPASADQVVSNLATQARKVADSIRPDSAAPADRGADSKAASQPAAPARP